MKDRLSSKKLAIYTKYKIGYAGAKNQSMYDLACKALEKDKLFKPCSITAKQWVTNNFEFIANIVESIKKPSSVKSNFTIVKEIKKTKTPSTGFASSNAFLQTYEWRKVRMEALKKYGARCQCCGATPATGAIMNVDHIKPRKIFPELALSVDNLQVLCHECNHGKGNWDMTDWRTNKYFVKLPNI